MVQLKPNYWGRGKKKKKLNFMKKKKDKIVNYN